MILNIETATTNCSVSIAHEGLVVSFREYADVNYSHAEQLHSFISEALDAAVLKLSDLTAIAVSKGPGSYTGLRIGVSAAKGLCYALGIPLISVPTLQSLATKQSILEGEVIVPMLDARRMEVYMAAFNYSMQEVVATKAAIITLNSLDALAASFKKVHLIGSGVEKVLAIISNENIVGVLNALPSAKEMGPLSYTAFKLGDFEDVAYFEPYYLKDFMSLFPAKKA